MKAFQITEPWLSVTICLSFWLKSDWSCKAVQQITRHWNSFSRQRSEAPGRSAKSDSPPSSRKLSLNLMPEAGWNSPSACLYTAAYLRGKVIVAFTHLQWLIPSADIQYPSMCDGHGRCRKCQQFWEVIGLALLCFLLAIFHKRVPSNILWGFDMVRTDCPELSMPLAGEPVIIRGRNRYVGLRAAPPLLKQE